MARNWTHPPSRYLRRVLLIKPKRRSNVSSMKDGRSYSEVGQTSGSLQSHGSYNVQTIAIAQETEEKEAGKPKPPPMVGLIPINGVLEKTLLIRGHLTDFMDALREGELGLCSEARGTCTHSASSKGF